MNCWKVYYKEFRLNEMSRSLLCKDKKRTLIRYRMENVKNYVKYILNYENGLNYMEFWNT